MAMNVTLVLKKVYETGREPGERQMSVTGERFVRAHWFLLLAGSIYKISVQRYGLNPITLRLWRVMVTRQKSLLDSCHCG